MSTNVKGFFLMFVFLFSVVGIGLFFLIPFPIAMLEAAASASQQLQTPPTQTPPTAVPFVPPSGVVADSSPIGEVVSGIQISGECLIWTPAGHSYVAGYRVLPPIFEGAGDVRLDHLMVVQLQAIYATRGGHRVVQIDRQGSSLVVPLTRDGQVVLTGPSCPVSTVEAFDGLLTP